MNPRLRTAPRAMARRAGVRVTGYRLALRHPPRDADVLAAAAGPEHIIPELAGIFRTSLREGFFAGPADAETSVRALEANRPGWTGAVTADAERVRRRVVRLLGADEIDLDAATSASGLPWHEDLINDYRWRARCYFKAIPIPYGRADIRVPWELSRCQHLPTLGMAYVATGDDAHAREAMAQMDDWIAANRPLFGVNWSCAMDVAIRAVNWLWTISLVAPSPAVDNAFIERLLASLILHGRHIAANLERYDGGVTTNHTLADYVGLLYLGLVLSPLPEAEGWAAEGHAGVLECMDAQVLADGVDFENSIPYHRLVLEMFAGSLILVERHGRPFPGRYRDSLERMFDFVAHYTRPDGLAPLVGDADDGRLQILSRYFDWDPQDHRYLLALGGAIFGRADLAGGGRHAPGGVEEVVWHLGANALAAPVHEQRLARPQDSRAFVNSGRYIMRHLSHHAVISADEVGTRGMGNHKHNDIFSYELSVDGTAIVVDGGSYLYTSDLMWRDRFRSTRAHNTVSVDEVEQNELLGSFGMRTDARVTVHRWRTEPALDLFEASHTGYERLPAPATHRRTIAFAKDPFAWLVIDRLEGEGGHSFESSLRLAPGAETVAGAGLDGAGVAAAAARLAPEVGLQLHDDSLTVPPVHYRRSGTTVSIVPLHCAAPIAEEGWFAPRYGQRVPATMLRFREHRACPATFGYLILTDGARAWV